MCITLWSLDSRAVDFQIIRNNLSFSSNRKVFNLTSPRDVVYLVLSSRDAKPHTRFRIVRRLMGNGGHKTVDNITTPPTIAIFLPDRGLFRAVNMRQAWRNVRRNEKRTKRKWLQSLVTTRTTTMTVKLGDARVAIIFASLLGLFGPAHTCIRARGECSRCVPARGIWQVERRMPANPLEKTRSFAHTDKNGYVAASETSGERKREEKYGRRKKTESALETERETSAGENDTLRRLKRHEGLSRDATGQ